MVDYCVLMNWLFVCKFIFFIVNIVFNWFSLLKKFEFFFYFCYMILEDLVYIVYVCCCVLYIVYGIDMGVGNMVFGYKVLSSY